LLIASVFILERGWNDFRDTFSNVGCSVYLGGPPEPLFYKAAFLEETKSLLIESFRPAYISLGVLGLG
jgi:hypothetical protein